MVRACSSDVFFFRGLIKPLFNTGGGLLPRGGLSLSSLKSKIGIRELLLVSSISVVGAKKTFPPKQSVLNSSFTVII